MPSQSYMRDVIRQMYPGSRWSKRVDKMPDGQILAMYNKHINKTQPSKKEAQDEEPPSLPF